MGINATIDNIKQKFDGKSDTTVHEKVAPAVKHENIQYKNHEEVTKAIDKEVHQDHYHTTVQPVNAKEVRPTQHSENVLATEEREYDNRNASNIQQKLSHEASKFTDSVTRSESNTQSAGATVGGEHTHHHVHETIQPVIQKETIQPHVTHTTQPIHEVHHNAAKHHTTSALPAVSLAEFQKVGGVLNGREERQDAFEGAPQGLTHSAGGVTGQHHVSDAGVTGHNASGTGVTNTTGRESATQKIEDKLTGQHHGTQDTTAGHHHGTTTGHSGVDNTNTTGKETLGDKVKRVLS